MQTGRMSHTTDTLPGPAGGSTTTDPAGTSGGDAALLTTAEVLQRLRISRRTLATWLTRGLVPAIRMPGSRRLLWHWPTLLHALLRHQRGGAA